MIDMRFHLFHEGGRWWLAVPELLLFERERGLYSRRTFREVLREMDGFLARARAHGDIPEREEPLRSPALRVLHGGRS